ncbi:tyrosine-type recombinase/integrase [Paraburkholderia acidicola]|uniref:Tyrosine-type recombinase/integrase n=1 Tax=Paraburkholderia acidicola TaxID=1912599 RepID=A0ABV1LG46_9BURK
MNLKSKTAREKLAPRREPYWERVSLNVHIGYRKLEGVKAGGTWIGRRIGEDGKRQFHSMGSDATLEYDVARAAVAQWNKDLEEGVQNVRKDLTVAEVCREYVKMLREGGRVNTAYDAEKRFVRYVYPETCPIAKGERLPDGSKKRVDAFVYDSPIGSFRFARLRPIDVENWRNAQLYNDDPEDEDAYSRAQDSINRNMKSLKAAFNYAKDKMALVSTDSGWKNSEMFKTNAGKLVGARRDGLLTKEKRTALLAVMPEDLRMLATAMLLIGARPGELANATVSDFNKGAGQLKLKGKTGERKVDLQDTAVEFFTARTKDRIGNAPLLPMENGEHWSAPVWGKFFRQARELAKIPDAVLYFMRHTHISEAIAQGLDIFTVARQTGTSVEIIESNYGNHRTDNLRDRLNKISIVF